MIQPTAPADLRLVGQHSLLPPERLRAAAAATSRNAAGTRPRSAKYRAERRTKLAITLVFLITALVLASPISRLALVLYPAMAIGVALYSARRSSRLYVSYVLILWILTPFLRRFLDFRAGWSAASNVLLVTPMAAAVVPLLEVFRRPGRFLSQRSAPLFLILVSFLYGCGIGLFHFSVSSILQDLSQWLSAIAIAFYLYHRRDELPTIYRTLETAFLFGLIVAGSYGIIQFFLMPLWDAVWMQHSNIISIGLPERMKIRVFSTMNSPQVLASYLSTGLLLCFSARSRLKFVAIPMALLSLLLSLARSGWLGLLVGIAYLLFFLPNRQRFAVLLAIVLSGTTLFATLQNAYLQQVVSKRLDTFKSIKADNSYLDRTEGYVAFFESLEYYPYGLGIGAFNDGRSMETSPMGRDGKTVYMGDSMIATTITSFGILGSIVFCVAMLAALLEVFRGDAFRDRASRAVQAALAGLLVEAFLMPVLIGPTGFLTWLCIGLLLARKASFADRRELSRTQPRPSTSATPEFA